MSLGALLLICFLSALPQQEALPYSTCPSRSLEEDLRQNVAYMEVSTRWLMKYAKVKVQPKPPDSCRCGGKIKVVVKIEGDHVVCATAMGGHPLLQKAAVDAAMQWRFKEKRDSSDVTGVLVFDFND
jgi:hypothetical protein